MKTFGEIMNEYVNLDDRRSLEIVTTVNEADQEQLLDSLVDKLYNSIVSKVADIDFGNIPATRGDITKLQNYDELVDCANVIKDIVTHYKQNPESIQVVLDAIENIKSRVSVFERIFALDLDFGITIYNTMVLSCVSAVSFLITSSIEYIKRPDASFDIAMDKVGYAKSKDSLLTKNLKSFNNSCRNGDLDRSLDYIIESSRKNFVGTLSVTTAIIILIVSIIPFIRELIYFFYLFRQNTADYFEVQADLLLANAANIEKLDDEHSEMDKDTRQKISDKQKKIAERFRKISNFFNVKLKKAEKLTAAEMNNDTRKYDLDELMDTLPDSAGGNSSIF